MRTLIKKVALPVAVLTASAFSYYHFEVSSAVRSPASLDQESTIIKRTVKKIDRTTQIVVFDNAKANPEKVSEQKIPDQDIEKLPEVKPEAKEELASEVKPEAKEELVSEVKPEAKEELVSEVKPEAKEELASEVKPEAKEEVTAPMSEETVEVSEDKAQICVDEEDYNNMIDEIADLKKRMKTIASAIPEDLFSENQSNLLAQVQALQSMSSMMPTLNWNSMYQPWSMNNYLMNNMMMNWQMGNAMSPFIQGPASQVLGSSYQPFYNPITINNFNYGSNAGQNQNSSNVPANYYTGEMNFGGLDQVTFQKNPTNSSQPSTPAFFAF